jgi:hypothetical protein
MNFVVFGVQFRRVSGVRRYFQQFYALLVKHVIHSRRNIIVTLVQLFIPVMFAVVACVIEKTLDRPADSPPLPLNISYFVSPVVASSFYAGSSADTAAVAAAYRQVVTEYGKVDDIGSVDMDIYLLRILRDVDSGSRYHIIAGILLQFMQVYAENTRVPS